MTKHEFIIQYVLNRALAKSDGLDAEAAVYMAIAAWAVIRNTPPEAATKTP